MHLENSLIQISTILVQLNNTEKIGTGTQKLPRTNSVEAKLTFDNNWVPFFLELFIYFLQPRSITQSQYCVLL